jgi:hypothetical protein
MRSSLREWYLQNIAPLLKDNAADESGLCDGYCKITVLFNISSIYSNRLNTCMYWRGTSGMEDIEKETQRFARNIISKYEEETDTGFRRSLLLAQKLPVAEATIQSGDEWKKQLSVHANTSQDQLLKMPQQTFKHWCDLLGRTIL